MTENHRQYNEVKIVFSTKSAGTNGHAHVKKKMNLDTDLYPSQNLTQDGFYQYVEGKSIKLLEDNIGGEKLYDQGFNDLKIFFGYCRLIQ